MTFDLKFKKVMEVASPSVKEVMKSHHVGAEGGGLFVLTVTILQISIVYFLSKTPKQLLLVSSWFYRRFCDGKNNIIAWPKHIHFLSVSSESKKNL